MQASAVRQKYLPRLSRSLLPQWIYTFRFLIPFVGASLSLGQFLVFLLKVHLFLDIIVTLSHELWYVILIIIIQFEILSNFYVSISFKGGISKSLYTILNLSISAFSCISFCFTYLAACFLSICFQLYMFKTALSFWWLDPLSIYNVPLWIWQFSLLWSLSYLILINTAPLSCCWSLNVKYFSFSFYF